MTFATARRPASRGMTLVEVTISAALLAMAAMTFMLIFFGSHRLDVLTRERTWAREECRRQMEAVLATDFKTIPALDGATFDVGFDVNGVNGVSAGEKLKPSADTTATNIIQAPYHSTTKVGVIKVEGFQTLPSTNKGDADCYKITVTATWLTSTGKGGTAPGDTMQESFVANVADH